MSRVEHLAEHLRLEVHLPPEQALGELRQGLARALGRRPVVLSPAWLYDETGSALFDAITRLPEYYQTEAERRILVERAARIVELTGADTVVELGSGTSDKTRALLDAFWARGRLRTFVPFDVSEPTLLGAAEHLLERYPGIEVHGIVGDFTRHLAHLPVVGRRLVAFLGGTIGNLYPAERARFLRSLAAVLRPGEGLLLGIDLVKPLDRLVASYHDADGLTADFVTNVLRVLNREVGADFDLDRFQYVPLWDPAEERMDLRLRAVTGQRVHIAALATELSLAAGEELHVEVSAKFRPGVLADELGAAGLPVVETWTDPDRDFAVLLARRA
jgi:L-histidine Nalpha-methyltransferase